MKRPASQLKGHTEAFSWPECSRLARRGSRGRWRNAEIAMGNDPEVKEVQDVQGHPAQSNDLVVLGDSPPQPEGEIEGTPALLALATYLGFLIGSSWFPHHAFLISYPFSQWCVSASTPASAKQPLLCPSTDPNPPPLLPLTSPPSPTLSALQNKSASPSSSSRTAGSNGPSSLRLVHLHTDSLFLCMWVSQSR
jgi:hypothetical protein